jgi:hypothetical protein
VFRRHSVLLKPTQVALYRSAWVRYFGLCSSSVTTLLLLLWLYNSFLGIGRFFSFLILYTAGRTPWRGDQSVARPLPTHRTDAHNTDIHALRGVRTHNPRFRAREDSSCTRPRDHCDRRCNNCLVYTALE